DEVAAAAVAYALAMGDGAPELSQRVHLELEIGPEDLFNILADAQPAEHLKIGQAVEEQDTLRQLVGVLHLVDGFGALELGKLVHAPIAEQSVVQPILVGRGELVLQGFVEKLENLRIPLHAAADALKPRR